MMDHNDFELLLREVKSNRAARVAAEEAALRRRLAEAIDVARRRESLSIRELAQKMGTSLSQVQRLLHKEVGGSLTLKTVLRAADALNMSVTVHARPRPEIGARVIPFSDAEWTSLPRGETSSLPRRCELVRGNLGQLRPREWQDTTCTSVPGAGAAS